MLGDKNCHMAIRVEIGMRDCLRNNDIYYGGLRENRYLHYGGSLARLG